MSRTGPLVLLLSPHPDDIAWSVGGTVAALRAAGAELLTVTFFGRSRYAPGSASHGSSAATQVRRAEEDAWAAQAGVRLDRADLPDASLRGYDDDTEMGAEPSREIVAAAGRCLDGALALARPHLTLAPLAAGGHVDHAAVRRAVAGSRPGPPPGLIWYEDLPYAQSRTADRPGEPVTVDVSRHWAAKERGVGCYPSQLPDTVLPILRRHAATVAQRAAGRAERVWASSPAAGRRLRQLLAEPALKG
jgi:LmbE family N-acetylglucosaminyl deacetylase